VGDDGHIDNSDTVSQKGLLGVSFFVLAFSSSRPNELKLTFVLPSFSSSNQRFAEGMGITR